MVEYITLLSADESLQTCIYLYYLQSATKRVPSSLIGDRERSLLIELYCLRGVAKDFQVNYGGFVRYETANSSNAIDPNSSDVYDMTKTGSFLLQPLRRACTWLEDLHRLCRLDWRETMIVIDKKHGLFVLLNMLDYYCLRG